MVGIVWHAIRRRRAGLLWWSVGIAALAALLAVAYPTVRGNSELDKTFANLPPGVESLLGLGGGSLLTSPAGYLNSQFFANLLPILLLIFAAGTAAWSVAGDEAAGTFELLVANPVSRVRVALARFAALVVLLTVLATVAALTLIALAPSTGLDNGLSAGHLVAATLAAALVALTFAAVAFAIGATTGRRSAALGIASGLAVAGYVIEGLAQQVPALRVVRGGNPWHWLLSDDPLRHGLTWHTWALPLVVTIGLVAAAMPFLTRRDLH
ncbi:MAG: ABC transporter permease subunit [Actinocatenispora sp.]